MAIDGTIKVKQVGSIQAYGSGWGKYMDVVVEDMEISAYIKADEIVPEYEAADLLKEIGVTDVVSWLEGQGFTISEE